MVCPPPYLMGAGFRSFKGVFIPSRYNRLWVLVKSEGESPEQYPEIDDDGNPIMDDKDYYD